MTPKGPRSERETVINFHEEADTASIWTASDVVYRRLMKRLGRQYLTEDGERHAIDIRGEHTGGAGLHCRDRRQPRAAAEIDDAPS